LKWISDLGPNNHCRVIGYDQHLQKRDEIAVGRISLTWHFKSQWLAELEGGGGWEN